MIDKNNLKKTTLIILLLAIVLFAFNNKVHAEGEYHGEGTYCMNLNVEYETETTDHSGPYPQNKITSIKINNQDWVVGDYYNANVGEGDVLWTITIIAGDSGNNSLPYPFASTAGGFDQYGTYEAIPNPDADETPNNGDEYLITIKLKSSWSEKGDPTAEPRTCGTFRFRMTATDMPITRPDTIEHPSISISITGDELEYHYVEDKPNEDDVSRFKIGINNGVYENGHFVGTSSNGLIPFRFGNVTFKDGIEPPNATGARTTNDITDYEYAYNGSGTVDFCVIGGAADNYTKIQISGKSNNESHNYADQAPHSQVEVFEHIIGRASMFCITDVPYDSVGYDIVVEGERQPEQNIVTGFGWSHLSKVNSPTLQDGEEGDFAHGSLEFVSVLYTDIDQVEHYFDNVQTYNNTKYHGTGEIYEWRNGDRNYDDEDRRWAWGEALVPNGATLTVNVKPDPGYQLVSFTSSPNGFTPTETPGEYRVVISNENLYSQDADAFGFSARFEEIGNYVQTESNTVNEGTIITTQEVTNGTIKLEVSDVDNLSDEQRESFENKAAEQEYEVANVIDLSLYNAIYQGGKKDENDNYLSWDTELNNLDQNAIITLKLSDDLAGKDIAIVHEDHDENENPVYEFIESDYDEDTNTIGFGTNRFSNYAIVVKSNNENPDDPQNNEVTVDFDARGGEPVPQGVTLQRGESVAKPQNDPYKENVEFIGWFSDPGLNDEYDFNLEVNDNLVLYAKYSDDLGNNDDPENPDNPDPVYDTAYTLEDETETGSIISFMGEQDQQYHFEIIDYLSVPKETIVNNTPGMTSELYDQIFTGIQDQGNEKGTFLFFLGINVFREVEPDPEDPEDDGIRDFKDGPFTIKIPYTEELKDYTNFKLYYVQDDFTLGEAFNLELDDNEEYLVGILPHLSPYVMVGDENNTEEAGSGTTGDDNTTTDPQENNNSETSNNSGTTDNKTNNVKTNDNIYTYIILLIVSIIGLSVLPIKHFIKKHN